MHKKFCGVNVQLVSVKSETKKLELQKFAFFLMESLRQAQTDTL